MTVSAASKCRKLAGDALAARALEAVLQNVAPSTEYTRHLRYANGGYEEISPPLEQWKRRRTPLGASVVYQQWAIRKDPLKRRKQRLHLCCLKRNRAWRELRRRVRNAAPSRLEF